MYQKELQELRDIKASIKDLENILGDAPPLVLTPTEGLNFSLPQYRRQLEICDQLCNITHVFRDVKSLKDDLAMLRNQENEIESLHSSGSALYDRLQHTNVAFNIWCYAEMLLSHSSMSTLGKLSEQLRSIIRHNLIYTHFRRKALLIPDYNHALITSTSYRTSRTYRTDNDAYCAVRQNMSLPPKSKHRFRQDVFRQELDVYYGSNSYSGMDTWCPVMGESFQRKEITAAHIVPYSFGEENAERVFTNDRDFAFSPGNILMSKYNGLFLYKPIEQALDEGRLVIVPCSYGTKKSFKCYILDENLRTHSFGDQGRYLWKDFHQKKLQFQNDARPKRRFLYFRLLLTVLQHCYLRQDRPPNWAFYITDLITGDKWATEGEWLEKSAMKPIIALIGNLEIRNQLEKAIPIRQRRFGAGQGGRMDINFFQNFLPDLCLSGTFSASIRDRSSSLSGMLTSGRITFLTTALTLFSLIFVWYCTT